MSGKNIGRLCVWIDHHKSDGQLGPVLDGLEGVIAELMDLYNCSQVREAQLGQNFA
jgi:hypothetical protein